MRRNEASNAIDKHVGNRVRMRRLMLKMSQTKLGDTGHTTFKSINWGRADEPLSSGQAYRKDDIIHVAQQLLSKLPR
jgi:hypothetical protein